jgi:hypothetical protein
MRSLKRRIERLEEAWLPKAIAGKRQITWEQIDFLYKLRNAFSDPAKVPKFLQADYCLGSEMFKEVRAESSAAPPQSDP